MKLKIVEKGIIVLCRDMVAHEFKILNAAMRGKPDIVSKRGLQLFDLTAVYEPADQVVVFSAARNLYREEVPVLPFDEKLVRTERMPL